MCFPSLASDSVERLLNSWIQQYHNTTYEKELVNLGVKSIVKLGVENREMCWLLEYGIMRIETQHV
jgi:hypothetical protein